ncbi:ABC transporter ATP-binding protein [Streptomyces sp. NPDC002138]|uniref:ABC transporter ATP-binding protein n=1 Tax=Streptomyces sp. NPDC002138 TaxID=3154410 RepID=UPI003332FA3F
MSEETGHEAHGGAEVSDSEQLLFGGELAYDIGWEKHEGAWLKLGLWTMARNLPRMVAMGVRLAHLADARALRVVLGAELGRGITQAVGLVSVNSVLGHVLSSGSTTNERLARAGHLLGQLLTQQDAAAEVRVHEVGPFLLGHFRHMAETSEREQTRLARQAARIGLIADAAGGLATLLTYGALGVLLWTGTTALAVAGTAVLAIRTGTSSLDNLVLQITELHQESLFVSDFERLCSEATARAIPVGGDPLPEHLAEIRFEKVTFTYPGSTDETTPEPTLREVSLTVPMGKVVALVGENGSGKSTLIKLLAGLYLPDEGRGTIWWDGVDTAKADRGQIFARVALMSQSFYQWPFTFRVNVGIGRPTRPIDDRAVEAAATYSGADDVLAGLPRGLGTLLARGYRGGHQISGGQWQKIGISRAKYKDAQILVVDEPTSALDAVAEQKVFDQIRALAATGQTIVLITHRLYSVRHADLIHVLKNGRVAESGTSAELMDETTATGDFRNAYLVQAAAFADSLPAPRDGSPSSRTEERR